MKTNEIVYAKTHADFLNKLLGTTYKAWMKGCYNINSKYEIWMAHFDGKIRDGWKNTYLGDIIKDVNTNPDRKTWSNMSLPKTLNHTKLVFEVIDNPYGERKYVFKGVYEYQKDISNPYETRIYKKIGDYFVLKV